jgi:hypothetical protein
MTSRMLIALFTLLAACGQPPKASPTVIENHAHANENLGKHVGVRGTAGNAKLGAVIQTQAGLVVYCSGVEAWPPELDGKLVTAYGTLQQSDKNEAKTGPNGEVSQGTAGPIWLLANCTYDK